MSSKIECRQTEVVTATIGFWFWGCEEEVVEKDGTDGFVVLIS